MCLIPQPCIIGYTLTNALKMKYIALIGDNTYTVHASDAEEARYKLAQHLGVEIGELNKLKPQFFES